MKTAFKIQPPANPERHHDLLIEVGWESISFIYYLIDPLRIEGLHVYYFDKNITATQIADKLDSFFAEQNMPGYNNCTICYNYKECTIVPSLMYDNKMLSGTLDVLFANNSPVSDYAEPLKGMDAFALYRVDCKVEAVLKQQYINAKTQHSNSLTVPALQENNDALYCIIYQKSIKVILYKNADLQIVQYFDYTTPADVAYYLLHLCALHYISAVEINLKLSGFIDKKSNLYDELYRYFLNIQLDESAKDIEIASDINQYPLHFFSHLILLVKCVS